MLFFGEEVDLDRFVLESEEGQQKTNLVTVSRFRMLVEFHAFPFHRLVTCSDFGIYQSSVPGSPLKGPRMPSVIQPA